MSSRLKDDSTVNNLDLEGYEAAISSVTQFKFLYFRNETDVGKAIKKSGLSREELFVVTKAWTNEHGHDELRKGFEGSIER